MALGWDGYTILSKYDIIKEELLTGSDLLGIYIQEEFNGEIPEKYKALQGRISFKNSEKNEESEEKLKIVLNYYQL